MAKTLVAQNIANVNNIRFELGATGDLAKLEVTCEVNYGAQGIAETIDLLPLLTAGQKTAAKAFYDNLKAKLEAVLIS